MAGAEREKLSVAEGEKRRGGGGWHKSLVVEAGGGGELREVGGEKRREVVEKLRGVGGEGAGRTREDAGCNGEAHRRQTMGGA